MSDSLNLITDGGIETENAAPELTYEHRKFLNEAGASPEFMDLLTYPAERAGVKRHSVRQEILGRIRYGEIGPDKEPSVFSVYGGHFFLAMWNGDLFDAWLRADPNNRTLMLAVFGRDAIKRHGLGQGRRQEFVDSMVA